MSIVDTNHNETLGPVLRQLCEMARRRNEATGAPRTSSEFGQLLATRLNRVTHLIAVALDLEQHRRPRLKVTFSRGATTLPRVFWIGIVPDGKSVGNSMSASICFGMRGEGIVGGLMNCAFVPSKLSCTRRAKDEIQVDVDGPKPETRYNNRFYNPREFLVDNLDGHEVIDHLRTSIGFLTRELSA